MDKIWVVTDIKGYNIPDKQFIKYRGFTNYDRAMKFYSKTTDFFGFGILEVEMDESKPTENHTDRFKEI